MNSTRIISFAWVMLVLGLTVLPAASQNISDGEDLLEAVSAGNLERVRILLEAGVDVTTRIRSVIQPWGLQPRAGI